jgi:hypothetical protein
MWTMTRLPARALAMALPLFALLLPVLPARGETSLDKLAQLSDAERAALVQRTPRAELGAFLRATNVDDLLALGRRTLSGLAVYGARMTKQERVSGKLYDPQIIQLTLREEPLALRLRFVDGPSSGRIVVYNSELRRDEIRVREGGFFGLVAVWVGLDSSLTRGDTNHRVTEVGFGALLRLLQRDLDRARPHGGFARTDEGFDERSAYCMLFDAPKGAEGLSGDRSRICIDAAVGLPVRVEVYRKGELYERYSFERVTPRLVVPPDYFTPEAAGL